MTTATPEPDGTQAGRPITQEDGAHAARTSEPAGPLKSKLPVLCGSILICEICVVYFAGLTGIGLKPVSLPLLITGAAVISVVLIAAALLLPRRIGQQRPGIALGWVGQLLIITSGFVMTAMFFVGFVFAALYAVAVYWGRRIDREVVEYFRNGGER